jgi:ABC-type polysaccharide/polyol phosphate transport system ATPase subunit
MSDELALRLTGVSKMYKLFPSRLDAALEALGLTRAMPWRQGKGQQFWALRDVNLDLRVGSRLGIVGRNGAGKSTLLKLITGNVAATEGEVWVRGDVQALLEAGAGFHPEFTGYENIRASLAYQGLGEKDIDAAIEEIADFTELGHFLGQPFKTYSTGMQARLIFATATVLKPEILIIDEILGAGDAYFASKSGERMKRLVEDSGASVLLVSHAMPQVLQYCDECLWLERGRVVMRGPSIDVVNAYEGFIRDLEDRRLKARNRKRRAGYGGGEADVYSDGLALTFTVQGERGAGCDVAEIALLKNGVVEETLRVGDVQDASGGYATALVLQGSDWSEPRRDRDGWSRRLDIRPDGAGRARGWAIFYAYMLFDDAEYSLRVRYRCEAAAGLSLAVSRNGSPLGDPTELATGGAAWREETVKVSSLGSAAREPRGDVDPRGHPPKGQGGRAIVRWPGEGSITIERAVLLGPDGHERAVFTVGEPLVLSMIVVAHRAGRYNPVAGATLIRLDGVYVSNFVSDPMPADLAEGESVELRLDVMPLNLGDGHFVFSLSIFEGSVALDGSTRYDLIARAYEFQVVGNPPLAAEAIFQHPGTWSLRRTCSTSWPIR